MAGPELCRCSSGTASPASTGYLRRLAEAAQPLGRQRSSSLGRQCPVELMARADAELGEYLAQVVLDRVPADEQLCSDLGVGETVASKPGDPGLLSRERLPGLNHAFAHMLARCEQLPFGAL